MAYEPVLNLGELIAPIPGENPCGENLLYAGLHDQMREARRAEDVLPQGDWEREVKVADWHQVVRLATDALSSKTKDLQVAGWLGEALVKLHGFPGLLDGLKLMSGLMELHWDHVYPEMEEGDLEARANACSFFDRQTAYALKEAPITNSATGLNYSYFQWEESKRFDIPDDLSQFDSDAAERLKALEEQSEQEHRVTSRHWRVALNGSRRAFYEELFALLKSCGEEFTRLDRVMDEKFQRQTPGLGALKKSLEDVTSLIEKIVKEKRVLEPDAVSAEEVAEGEAVAAEGGPAGATGPIRNRQDALRRLEQVAEYFRKTEPHSPVAYLVERASRWGQMSLESWLNEVIKEPGVLDQLRDTLGLKSPSGAG
jgi:type VI secretion system protein ImpA